MHRVTGPEGWGQDQLGASRSIPRWEPRGRGSGLLWPGLWGPLFSTVNTGPSLVSFYNEAFVLQSLFLCATWSDRVRESCWCSRCQGQIRRIRVSLEPGSCLWASLSPVGWRAWRLAPLLVAEPGGLVSPGLPLACALGSVLTCSYPQGPCRWPAGADSEEKLSESQKLLESR